MSKLDENFTKLQCFLYMKFEEKNILRVFIHLNSEFSENMQDSVLLFIEVETKNKRADSCPKFKR